MRKWFVLSKRTTISKRLVTECFGTDNVVVIPMAVLDEIQEVSKTQFDERGKIARELLEYLWSLDHRKLFGTEGVVQPNGSLLFITTNYHDIKLPEVIENTKVTSLERRILQTCLGIRAKISPKEKVILISKNPVLRMKAELAGIEAQTFRDELLLEISEQYTGRVQIEVSPDVIDRFYREKKIHVRELSDIDNTFYQNMFVIMKAGQNATSAIGRVENGDIVPLMYDKTYPYGVRPKNVGQKFMIEALMTDYERAPLVIIKGPAGTAKTFMALAAGLEHVQQQRFPNKILISRSPTETGEKIGFLPGDETAKIGPYLRGIKDNLGILHSSSNEKVEQIRSGKKANRGRCYGGYRGEYDYEEKPTSEDGTTILESGMIKAEAVGFIRGRSICDTYIIIDEAQNLTPTEIKTIITRVGTGTKLVIIGDPAQIDRPELNERNNGISYAAEHLKGEKTCWQITMTDEESVRSELARRASKLL